MAAVPRGGGGGNAARPNSASAQAAEASDQDAKDAAAQAAVDDAEEGGIDLDEGDAPPASAHTHQWDLHRQAQDAVDSGAVPAGAFPGVPPAHAERTEKLQGRALAKDGKWQAPTPEVWRQPPPAAQAPVIATTAEEYRRTLVHQANASGREKHRRLSECAIPGGCYLIGEDYYDALGEPLDKEAVERAMVALNG